MLALLAGPYPALPGDPPARLRATLEDQLAAGCGVVSDGIVHDPLPDGAPAALVAAWRTARAVADALAADAGVPPVPVGLVLRGPLAAGGADAVAVARVRAACDALAAAGAPAVILAEPWLLDPAAATDAGRARALAAWRPLLDGLALHVTLAAHGGALAPFGAEALAAAPFPSHYLDLIHGPDDWRVAARLPTERGVVLGVADPRTLAPDPLAVLVWAARYAAAQGGRGPDRVALAPAGGFADLPPAIARGKLVLLAQAAHTAVLAPDALARTLDPRAVSARAAATGAVRPPTRRRPARRPGVPDAG